MTSKTSLYRKNTEGALFTPLTSCADLYVRINKVFSVITKLVNQLMEQGLVIETGYALSTGGESAPSPMQ